MGGRRVWVGGGCGWEEGVGGRRVWVGGGCGWEEGGRRVRDQLCRRTKKVHVGRVCKRKWKMLM